MSAFQIEDKDEARSASSGKGADKMLQWLQIELQDIDTGDLNRHSTLQGMLQSWQEKTDPKSQAEIHDARPIPLIPGDAGVSSLRLSQRLNEHEIAVFTLFFLTY